MLLHNLKSPLRSLYIQQEEAKLRLFYKHIHNLIILSA